MVVLHHLLDTPFSGTRWRPTASSWTQAPPAVSARQDEFTGASLGDERSCTLNVFSATAIAFVVCAGHFDTSSLRAGSICCRDLPLCRMVGGRAIPVPHQTGGLEQIPDSAATIQLELG